MENRILQFVVIFLSFLLIDSVYLATFGQKFLAMVREIQAAQVEFRIVPAFLCYIFLSLALLFFIVVPHKNWMYAFLLGICIYGVYETTSYSLIKKWRMNLAIIDTVWGGILFVLVAMFSRFLMKWINKVIN